MAATLKLPQFATFHQQTHGLMLIGINGHASNFEAQQLAMTIAGATGTVQTITRSADKTGIAIGQIRELYTATRAKSAGVKRVWIIEDAETMSLEAQNAFLKLLEEPPADVFFILCVKQATSLLPTIQSRVQRIQCKPVNKQSAEAYLHELSLTAQVVQQLLFLAAGSASELHKLAEDEAYRQKQLEYAAIAKQLLSASTFEKIVIVQKLGADREQALTVLRLSLQMLHTLASKQAAQKLSLQQLKRLLGAFESIDQNGNVKLQLLQAIL